MKKLNEDAMASLDSTSGMGAPELASRGVQGSGDITMPAKRKKKVHNFESFLASESVVDESTTNSKDFQYEDKFEDKVNINLEDFLENDDIDKITIDLKYDIQVQQAKFGIEGLEPIIKELKVTVKYYLLDNDEPKEEEFIIDPKNIVTTKKEKIIPFSMTGADINFKNKTAEIYFGVD